MPYLIRVRLPDQPGALGRLATALGAAGVDIDGVAVVDRLGGTAVDDLVVTLAPPALAESIVTAVLSVDGVVLESIQPHPGRLRVHDELALLDEALASSDPVQTLIRGLPDLLAVRYALAVDVAAPELVVATSAGAPDTDVLGDWIPLTEAGRLQPHRLLRDPAAAGPDVMLVAAPLSPTAAIVVGRNGGAEFRAAEVLRLAHLANLLRIG